jgi:hypothetical protein
MVSRISAAARPASLIAPVAASGEPDWSMFRKSGSRFSEKDMRQLKNLEHIPIQLNRGVL